MSGWEEAAKRALTSRATLIIGSPDTGKSTFFTEVGKRARKQVAAIGLIDADLGQKTIGPPATVGLTIAEGESKRSFLFFVGDTTPASLSLEAVLGVRAMARRATDEGCPSVVIDTSGLAVGELGARLKCAKAELVGADTAVIIEKETELEGLARSLESRGMEVLRVKAPAGVITRPATERAARRRERFASYFAEAEEHVLSLSQVAVLPTRRNLEDCAGLLVGLLDRSWNTLAMGILLRASGEEIELLAPSIRADEIRLVRPGVLKVAPDGTESGRI